MVSQSGKQQKSEFGFNFESLSSSLAHNRRGSASLIAQRFIHEQRIA